MISVEIIKELRPNKFIVKNKSEGKEETYSKQFLKRYYEMGKINVENPKKLYSGI